MGRYDMFQAIRAGARKSDLTIDNLSALGLDDSTRSLHILWMYPDVLEMHGDRGNVMALLHYSNLLQLPCTIRKCNTLLEEIPFDWADMIYFPSGDLACMQDVSNALQPRKADFERFAAEGKAVIAIASTGALLARKVTMLNGNSFVGLGLLNMEMAQRKTVFGDDLWFETENGLKVIGNEIQTADTRLGEGQAPLGRVIYGRGNCGDGYEGARSGAVIFTHTTGPVFARNPRFTEAVLKGCAAHAGLAWSAETHSLSDEDIALELAANRDFETFIRSKQQQ